MAADYLHVDWPAAEPDARSLVVLARDEDLRDGQDLTTNAFVAPDRRGAADFVAREAGIVCGLPIGPLVREAFDASFEWSPAVEDGATIAAGDRLATISGPARELLTCERTLLNFIGRLSGVATLASQYAKLVRGTKARVYDTRKTTPGWRRLEKYAVACGGATNHRTGLYDAVLIKDNHLAFAADHGMPLDAAIRKAKQSVPPGVVIEIEVDTLEQLRRALTEQPDVVLLDNMTCEQLNAAVRLRDEAAPAVQLEASGGVTIDTLAAIARTGVDRVSVGALTHSAKSLDVGLDWRSQP